MAFDSFRVYRVPNTWQDEEAEHLARMLDAVARSREVLKCRLPDTFVGRKSQEPFPKEGDLADFGSTDDSPPDIARHLA